MCPRARAPPLGSEDEGVRVRHATRRGDGPPPRPELCSRGPCRLGAPPPDGGRDSDRILFGGFPPTVRAAPPRGDDRRRPERRLGPRRNGPSVDRPSTTPASLPSRRLGEPVCRRSSIRTRDVGKSRGLASCPPAPGNRRFLNPGRVLSCSITN